MNNETVKVVRNGPIIDIRIDRPEARNALNRETIAELIRAFNSISEHADVRCVIFGGTGSDAFCAGADISELVHQSAPNARREFFNSIASLIEAIHTCPVPVVARVHGFALAGGCGIAAACDIVLASEEAVFGLPEVAVGLAALTVMAPIHRAIGRRGLAELVLTGDRIDAHRALALNLVTRVVPKEKLDAEAISVSEKICKHSPAAVKKSKEMILQVSEREYLPLLRELADQSAILSLGAEAREGLTAFLEKRAPAWSTPNEAKATT